MTKDGIKAVRFCTGYNTDLRCKLAWNFRSETCYERTISNFLFANRWGIFGSDFLKKAGASADFKSEHPLSNVDIENNQKITEFIRNESRQICFGEAEG